MSTIRMLNCDVSGPLPGNRLSRRGFLQAGLLSGLSLVLNPVLRLNGTITEEQGRVIEAEVALYAAPSLTSSTLKTYLKDSVLPISEVTIGDVEPAHNRVWYRIGTEGYVHSGMIQPVRTQLNPVVTEIPASGRLAEVTVPFTDAHWGVGRNFPVAYRLYYETTHWVNGLSHDKAGDPWYRIKDDKWNIRYYAPATHLRILALDELTPLSPDIPPNAKRIEVLTPEQAVIAYEWDKPVFITRTATGAKFSNGNFATPAGRHITNHKRPYRHMAAGNLAYNGYDLPGVPWVTYITENGISFHGTYWHNNYGRPRSHGCINLTPKAAKWIYRWTLPIVPPEEHFVFEDYGTPVDVM